MTEAIAQPTPKQQYTAYIERLTRQVVDALPISVRDEDLKRARARFRVAFSADGYEAKFRGDGSQAPTLLDCTGESIARAIVLSAMSGLFPGGPKPDVWLIPRRNKHRSNALECNWQLSFRGYLRLARRAGYDLEPVLVYEGEDFKLEEGNYPKIHHVRNLEIEPSWDLLRFGYVRVFRQGHREEAKIAYLTKKQIMQRRAKAQDQGIWNEWPLEMALKTLCHYAGNREMFPVDDPARYAMEASDSAELGAGSAVAIGTSIPAASEPRSLPEAHEGAVIGLPAAHTIEAEMITDDRLGPDPHAAPVQIAEDLKPPVEGLAGLSGDELSNLIRDELKRLKTKVDQEDACERHFLTKDRLAVFKLAPDKKAAGLASLRAELDGLAEMAAEREPGEDG